MSDWNRSSINLINSGHITLRCPTLFLPRNSTLAGLLVLCSVFLICCNSRYAKSRCPGNPFPESKELLRQYPFAKLVYFKGNSSEFEIWGDRKFEFTVSLRYHYKKDAINRSDCPSAVTLVLTSPLSAEQETFAHRFIHDFEKILHADLRSVDSAITECLLTRKMNYLYRLDLGEIVAEVSTIHQAVRGEVLQVGFFKKDYYESTLVSP